MKKRILSILLALCMCLTFVPVTVLAEDLPQQDNSIRALSISPDPDNTTYYTYEFYVNDNKVDTQIVKNGDTLLEPQVEAQAGKVFTGWDPAVPFGTVSGLTGENKTIRVDAVFADGYYVYFKDNTGRIIATKTGTTGQTITFEDVSFAVGTDEAITGWYKDKDCTDGNKVESVDIVNSNITLYAKVEKGYWITFESDGGSYVAPVFYATSATAAAPAAPTKPGYTFAGWYTDKDLTTQADFATIKTNTTVYAKWTAENQTNYTVIHWQENVDDNKFSFKESETKTGTTRAQTNATAKTYKGFTAQTITQQTIKGDGSTIVNVYYKRNEYSVKFYTNSTWSSPSTEYTGLRITAKYGAYIGDQWPTYNGSSTWATSNNGKTYQVNIDTMPLNGASFYGPRTGNGSETAYYYVEVLPGESGYTYHGVTYKLHHSDTSPGTGYTISDEDKYPITGFTFKEFSAQYNGGIFGGGYSYNNAKFYYTRDSYNIVFMNNGVKEKTVSRMFEQSIADANYTPTAPTGKEGYTFAGWYDNELCEGTPYVFSGSMPAKNITVYAKWVAPTYTVTVHDVDGAVHYTFREVAKNSTISSDSIPTLTLAEGETFLGWVQEDGTPFNFNTKINQNYDLYAKVGNNSRYTVTYHSNTASDTTITDNEMIYAKDVFATVNANAFTNGSKVFLSWNTESDGSGTTYYPNGTIKVTGNMELYAIWGDKASTVTVTYHSNFGTDQEYTTEAMPNNEQIKVADYSALGLPTHTGYSFTGWNTEANGTGTAFAAGASARVDNLGSGNVLYAQWAPNTNTKYTVEFYYQDGDSYRLDHSDPRTGTTDTTVSVTDVDKADKENGKYVYDTTAANVESGKVAADGSLVLKLYFKLNQADVTVNYYWNETTNKVATSKTLSAQTVGSVITTETPITIEGYTALPNQTSSLTVGADASKNVINFYYYKNVELTANSATYTYDGTEKSVSGFTGAPDGADFSAITVGAKRTNANTYPATFAEGTEGTVDTTKKYIVTKATAGQLEIKQRNVTITGESASKTYNSKVQEITGITVEGLVDGHRLTGLTYSAKGKDAGKYDGSFTGRTVITDTDGKVVTDNYNVKTVAGVLTITRSYRPSTPSTPSTPVTSVKTGDMGIALYAMTSLLSLSGAVAIIKKRKEDEK